MCNKPGCIAEVIQRFLVLAKIGIEVQKSLYDASPSRSDITKVHGMLRSRRSKIVIPIRHVLTDREARQPTAVATSPFDNKNVTTSNRKAGTLESLFRKFQQIRKNCPGNVSLGSTIF
jgi:hypothetical protein